MLQEPTPSRCQREHRGPHTSTMELPQITYLLDGSSQTLQTSRNLEAILRVLCQACRLILLHWKSDTSPTLSEWAKQMGDTLRMEHTIYQHRGCPAKFEKNLVSLAGLCPLDLAAGWLGILGMSPTYISLRWRRDITDLPTMHQMDMPY